MTFITCGALLFLGYLALLLFYRKGWKGVWSGIAKPAITAGAPETSLPFLSVLVPARNEAQNLPALIEALRDQSYPQHLLEVLVLDDHSSDGTAGLVGEAGGNIRPLAVPEAVQGKKAAIAYGVSQSKGTWIIATDADCRPQPGWLLSLSAFFEKAEFIAAPVRYRQPDGFCSIFQTLDFMTLQGITAASVHLDFHSMCNGANLAYTKAAFEAVDGFAGIDKLASGDDLLLMHKIAKRFPGRVFYCADEAAIVDTDPAPGWAAFWKQRIRWASKSAYYDDIRIFWSLMLVYGFNVYFVVLAIACFWYHALAWTLLCLIILKTAAELFFLAPVARFFKQSRLLGWFPLMQPVHILYTFLVGLLSQFGHYEWKGRRVR